MASFLLMKTIYLDILAVYTNYNLKLYVFKLYFFFCGKFGYLFNIRLLLNKISTVNCQVFLLYEFIFFAEFKILALANIKKQNTI